jgi:glycosyltransferase involved in cell wall biosynthesis
MLAAETPLIPEIGVLAMPYHRFGTRWMTPHHVMTRLASYFQVLWLETPHHWREIRTQRGRQAAMDEFLGSLPKGFGVYVPEPWLFNIHRPGWLHRRLFEARVRRAWRHLERRGCRKSVLHLWHYQFEAALEVGHHDLSLYHIDDEYSFTPDPPPMDPAEARVIRAVDQVFAISPGLMERKSGINPRIAFAPEGVDYRLYSTPVPEPPDIAGIPHPRIGYTGTLKVQLDWPLLRDLARRNPGWSFVFVGPRVLSEEASVIVDDLSRLSNVHLLGPKTVKDLAAYPQHFDVAVMPYLVNGYTNNIYPLKLHEYLASGTPVVGSPVRSLKDFNKVIALATTAEEWSAALAAALESPAVSADSAAARQAVAQQYDWAELTYDIARTICERLGPPYAARVRKLAVDTPSLSA